jgi:hypothetical protein
VVIIGVAFISAAWFRVIPVTANNSIPTKHNADVIQCHCLTVPSKFESFIIKYNELTTILSRAIIHMKF